MKANEQNFISLIKAGREEGILYVIETYGGLLKSVVNKRLSAFPDRAEECMNDIFFGIWQNIDRFDETKGTFAAWACGAARLEAIDTLRKLQREKATVTLENLEIPQEDAALLQSIERELSEETEAVLNCLSEKDRELFQRIYLEDQNHETAGQAMGMSKDNVYVRLFRGKKKIRKMFQEGRRINT